MRHFDVQLIGGIVLHEGKISEMKTGEGKNACRHAAGRSECACGRGVHIVTVNGLSARRDAEWMSPLYRALGLSVGVIVHDLDDDQRRAAYGQTSRTAQQRFGFDYLRDNMKYDLAQCVQRGHQFAIVDRSRLHPHRRGAHPADHFRAVGRVHRQNTPRSTRLFLN